MTDRRPKRESDPAHIARCVAASEPNLHRPRLAPEYEARLYESDRERARAYASLESMTEQLKDLADDLASEDDGIPIEIDEDEQSLAMSIDGVKAITDTR